MSDSNKTTDGPRLQIVPLSLKRANELVRFWHRHHQPIAKAKFALGVADTGRLCGAAIVSHPVARLLDDGVSLEVSRSVTDGTKNANSALYGAISRAAKAMGYVRVLTYIRQDEPGTSLKAAGWICDDPEIRRRKWNMANRVREDKTEIIERQRWVWYSGLEAVDLIFPEFERPQLCMAI